MIRSVMANAGDAMHCYLLASQAVHGSMYVILSFSHLSLFSLPSLFLLFLTHRCNTKLIDCCFFTDL